MRPAMRRGGYPVPVPVYDEVTYDADVDDEAARMIADTDDMLGMVAPSQPPAAASRAQSFGAAPARGVFAAIVSAALPLVGIVAVASAPAALEWWRNR